VACLGIVKAAFELRNGSWRFEFKSSVDVWSCVCLIRARFVLGVHRLPLSVLHHLLVLGVNALISHLVVQIVIEKLNLGLI
jgi:hypothetical protein